MLKGEKFKLTRNNLRLFTFVAALFWTMVLVFSIFLDIDRENKEIRANAKIWAQSLFERDIIMRRWNAQHGGVYVQITDNNPPNPWLSDLPERDLLTPSGRRLTLVNPSNMTRQIIEFQEIDHGVQEHLTSLNPIRPENSPDDWELQALNLFAEGALEHSSLENIDGKRYYRYMKPLVTEQGCLKCHAEQGYQVGEIYGGISVAVPLKVLIEQTQEGKLSYILGHFILWLTGLAGIIISYRLFDLKLRERLEAEVSLHNQAVFVLNNPAPVLRANLHGIIITINPAGLKILDKDLLGKPICTILPLLSQNKLNQIKDSKTDRLEQSIGDKIYLFEIRYEKSTHSFYIYGNDITELKKTEEDLRRSKDRLALHIEQTPLAFIEWNTSLEVVDWNQAAEKIFGFSKSEMLGRHAFDSIVQPENIESCKKVWQDLLNQSGGECSQGTNLTKDGKLIYCDWHNTPLVDSNGQVVGIVSLAHDVTRRREMEISRRENLQLLEILLETVPNPMYFKDKTGAYTGCNRAFAKDILGLTKEQIIGKTVYDFPQQISREQAEIYYKADLRLFNNPGTQEFETEVACSDGQLHDFLFNKATYTNIAGEVVGIVGIMHDLTEIRRVEQALRVSEIKFRSIFDNAQVGLFRLAWPEGKLLECNEKFSQIAGYKTVEKCLLQFKIMEHCLDPKAGLQMLSKVQSYGEVKNYEVQVSGADGNTKWLRYSARLFEDGNYLQGMAEDITQEKQAFEMIRKSNQKVINILASISDGFYTLDKEMKITYFNLAAEKILDQRGEKVLGKNLFEIFPHFKNTIIYAEYLRVLDEGKPRAFEVSLYTKGQEEWYDIRVYPNEEGVSVYFQEITERKQFEQMLVDKEYRLRSIFTAAADGFVVIDRQGWIDSINPAALKIFGYDGESLNCKNITELIPDFIKSCFEISKNNFLGSGLILQSGEFRGTRADGVEVPVKASISEILLHNQPYYTVVIYDLTGEQENIRRLIDVAKFSSIGTLAAGIAHEFKNYLAGIIGNASYALENMNDESPDLARETLEQIVDISESANQTAVSLLTYSRKNPQLKSREDVNTLIESVIKLVKKEALVSEIEIVTCLGNLPRILIMPARVQQMILNIMLNAMQAIGTQGKIEVSSELADGFVEIRIADNGCGIPPDKIDRIFDPFFSTKGVWGKEKNSGIGLGLSISSNIAAEHNGSIEVESKAGRGATFSIRLQAVEYERADDVLSDRLDKHKCALFSVNDNFIKAYQRFCDYKELQGPVFDSCVQLQSFESASLLVIIDAQYPGLGELYRAADYCKQHKIDFVLINTGDVPEMQLQGLIDDALTIHAGWPQVLMMSPADTVLTT